MNVRQKKLGVIRANTRLTDNVVFDLK